MLKLNDISPEPLQSQIVRQIRIQILGGELPAGQSLPSIRSLAQALGVSIITVQRAYNLLEIEGLIHSRRGKGFFVSAIRDKSRKKIAKKRLTTEAEPLIQTASSEGLSGSEIALVLNHLVRKVESTNKNQ